RADFPVPQVGRHQDETLWRAGELPPDLFTLEADREGPFGAQTLVSFRETPGELPEGTVDPSLPLPPAAGAKHRHQIGGDGRADLAQSEPEERREQSDHEAQRAGGQDADPEPMKAEPEDAGDMERPQDAAGPAGLRRMRGWFLTKRNTHGCRTFELLFRSRRNSDSSAGRTRNVAIRQAVTPRATRVPAFRMPGTRDDPRLPKPTPVVNAIRIIASPESTMVPRIPSSGRKRPPWTE